MIAVVPFAFIVGVAVASYISNNISLTRRTYCCCCCFCFLLLPSGICHVYFTDMKVLHRSGKS